MDSHFTLENKSRFPWEFREIRPPVFYVCRLAFICLLRSVKYKRCITPELLAKQKMQFKTIHSNYKEITNETEQTGPGCLNRRQFTSLLLYMIHNKRCHPTCKPAWPSSTAFRADLSTRIAVGLFRKISLHHFTVSSSSFSSCRLQKH